MHSNLVMKKFEFYCYSAFYDLFLTASNKSAKNDSAVFQSCILAAILVFFCCCLSIYSATVLAYERFQLVDWFTNFYFQW